MTATAGPSPLSPVPEPLDHYFETGGARLRYRDEGAGPAVILVHGWTLDLEMWEPQVAALRRDFRLVRLDRRGHGLSGGLPDTNRDAADLATLCAHLGITRCSLIGMSQGARGVLGFASATPGAAQAMILDGPPALESGESDDVPVAAFQALAQRAGMAAFRREWARLPLVQLRTRDARAHALLAAMIERYPGHELLEATPATGAVVLPLGNLRIPTLILLGEHDSPSRAQAAQFLCAQLPDAQRVVIGDAGHLPNLDQPARYSDLCRAFLARHADRGA
jgi:pimeloyl-ACP methyl ester carboxylesterase